MNHLPIYGISPRNKMSEKADTTTLLPKTYMPCSSSTRTNIKRTGAVVPPAESQGNGGNLPPLPCFFKTPLSDSGKKLLELRSLHHSLLPAPKQQNDTYTIKTVFLRSDNKYDVNDSHTFPARRIALAVWHFSLCSAGTSLQPLLGHGAAVQSRCGRPLGPALYQRGLYDPPYGLR